MTDRAMKKHPKASAEAVPKHHRRLAARDGQKGATFAVRCMNDRYPMLAAGAKLRRHQAAYRPQQSTEHSKPTIHSPLKPSVPA